MKRGIVLVCLVLFLFAFTIHLASAQPAFVDLISSDWFNAGLLFALVFVICFVVLKQVFHSNIGVAVVISVILGVAGSFSVIARYGTIFGNFDWVILALVVFIVAAFLASLSKDKKTSLTMFMFAVPVAWWAWGRGFFCAPRGTLSLNTCVIVDVVAGILIVIAIIQFLRALLAKRNELGPYRDAFKRGRVEEWGPAGTKKFSFEKAQKDLEKLKKDLRNEPILTKGQANAKLREYKLKEKQLQQEAKIENEKLRKREEALYKQEEAYRRAMAGS